MKKILIVEDNEMNRDMLSRRLVPKGFEVALAVDGREGMAMAAAEGAGPHPDGREPAGDRRMATRPRAECKANRALTGTHVPVIALTAYAMVEGPGKGAGGRLQRLRHQAGGSRQVARQIRGALLGQHTR